MDVSRNRIRPPPCEKRLTDTRVSGLPHPRPARSGAATAHWRGEAREPRALCRKSRHTRVSLRAVAASAAVSRVDRALLLDVGRAGLGQIQGDALRCLHALPHDSRVPRAPRPPIDARVTRLASAACGAGGGADGPLERRLARDDGDAAVSERIDAAVWARRGRQRVVQVSLVGVRDGNLRRTRDVQPSAVHVPVFLAAIADTPKAVKYLDMPLQHASRNVLKLMKRGGTRESLEKLIARVRAKVPGIAIRTTFITGFPGETDADFEELFKFVQNCRFDNLGVFTYSDEEGTAAFDLPNKVDPKTAAKRRNRLMKEQAKISKQINRSKIGNTYKVLFEGLSQESDLLFQGRLEGQTQEIDGYILINDMPENLDPKIGAIYNVKITEAHEYDLIGAII